MIEITLDKKKMLTFGNFVTDKAEEMKLKPIEFCKALEVLLESMKEIEQEQPELIKSLNLKL